MPSSNVFPCLAIFFAILAPLFCTAADVLQLADGASIEGQVIRDTPEDPLVVINTGGKLLILNHSEIKSIALDEEGRAEYKKRSTSAPNLSADAHFEIYKWAQARRLFDFADIELSATLRSNPQHTAARKIISALRNQQQLADAKLKTELAIAQVPALENNDTPVIGLRPKATPERARDAFEAHILTQCRTLSVPTDSNDPARKNALLALFKDPAKSAAALQKLLDTWSTPEDGDRLAVLSGIETLKPVSPEMSRLLASAALGDPSEPVRKRTAALVKARNDEWAMNALVETLLSSYEETGFVKDETLNRVAVAAINEIGDKRFYTALLYRATLEIRTAVSELNSLTTRSIGAIGFVNNGNNSIPVRYNLPIQFPDLKLTSVKTTVCVPCAALTSLTGQDFGNDIEAWDKWIRKQK